MLNLAPIIRNVGYDYKLRCSDPLGVAVRDIRSLLAEVEQLRAEVERLHAIDLAHDCEDNTELESTK